MLSRALEKTGRSIVLSLSPGPAPLEKTEEMRQYSQMWRISNDIWDLWHSTVEYPQGLGDQFANVAKWAGVAQPGHWPDADMLPLGHLGPERGWGQVRGTRLTHDEQRTLMTLWCIFPSPLMVGGELPSADAWTTSLLSNAEVIAMDQHSTGNHPVITADKVVVWVAQSSLTNSQYLAVFNISESSQALQYTWKDLGFTGPKYKLRDLWQRQDAGVAASIEVTVPPHGVVLYSMSPVRATGH
jgi:alpha-galactosidase